MYFSSVGGNFIKAQVQNHYETVRCNLYLKDISKRHIHSLTNINKSIKEMKDVLKDIQASSGYCDRVQGNEALSKSNVWKEREWSLGTSWPNDGDQDRRQASGKTSAFQETESKNLDSGEQPIVSKTTVDGVSRSSFSEKNDRNVLEHIENLVHSANVGSEVNRHRSDIGGLLRDEIPTLPDSRNVSGRVIKRPIRQGLASTVKNEPRRKSQVQSASPANGSNVPSTDATSAKLTGRSSGLVTSRTDEPLEFALGATKLGKSRPNTGNAGLMGYRSHTAPAKASHIKSAPAKGELKKTSSCRYSSANDVKKVKIHVNISRMERKRLLQELISSCTVPCDRSMLERQRQRLLQGKIERFFEVLFEQDDNYGEDDESDGFGDD